MSLETTLERLVSALERMNEQTERLLTQREQVASAAPAPQAALADPAPVKETAKPKPGKKAAAPAPEPEPEAEAEAEPEASTGEPAPDEDASGEDEGLGDEFPPATKEDIRNYHRTVSAKSDELRLKVKDVFKALRVEFNAESLDALAEEDRPRFFAEFKSRVGIEL